MTPRRLLVFLAVFLAVAAAYFLLTWREQRQEQAKQAAQRLYQVKDADITTLTLKRPGEAIHLEKKDDAWQIIRPIQAKADKDTVSSLLATLASLSRVRRPPAVCARVKQPRSASTNAGHSGALRASGVSLVQ